MEAEVKNPVENCMCQIAQNVISFYKCNEQKKPNSLKVFEKTNQWREDFLSRSAGNRESTMCTRITCRQCLAEVISWLLACSTQLNWKKGLFLLFLSLEPCDQNITNYCNILTYNRVFKFRLQEQSKVVKYRAQWLQCHLGINFISLRISLR
jgi:hypothetical protein